MNKLVKHMLGLLTVILLITATPAMAQDLSKTKAQLEKTRAAAKAEEARKAKAEQKLKIVQSELVATARKMQNIEQALSTLQEKQDDLEKRQAKLAEGLIRDKGLSTSLILAVYRSAKLPTYGLYFSNAPKSETLHRMIALNSTVPALHERMQGIESEMKELKILQSEISDVLAHRKQEQKKLKSETGTLNALLKDREKLYKTVSASHRQRLSEIKRLQKEAKDLTELMAKLKPAPRPEKITKTASAAAAVPVPSLPPETADKMLPVVGKVRISFGDQDDIGAVSSGITFSTQPQATVVSPMSGKVAFAGPFQNYKRLLIIEHNDGYHSLIAGLDSIETSVNSILQAGEPVGKITRQTNKNGRLYYELRKNGKPINPNAVFNTNTG
ncbi:MAG: murein hydrolase activator EnvC family protein [Pseudomonadota bacterium]